MMQVKRIKFFMFKDKHHFFENLLQHSLFVGACFFFCLSSCLFLTVHVFAADFSEANNSQAKGGVDFYNLSLAELGQIKVSIATGNATKLENAPSTASVIYAAQIDAMGAATLDDVLELIPGLHVSVTGWNRLDSHYSFRGMFTGYNPQVLFMINGVALRMSMLGSRPPLFRLPANCIERIEVIRGSGSAIYGADAYAGVINIITKDNSSIEKTRVSFHRGSFNQSEFSLQTATQWKGFDISFVGGWLKSDGDSSRRINSDLQTTLDSIFNTQASQAPGALSTRYNVVDAHFAMSSENLQFNVWRWMESNTGMGAGAAQALDSAGRYDANLLEADLTYHFFKNDVWDHSVTLSGIRNHEFDQYHIFPAGAVLPIGSDGNISFTAPVGLVNFSEGYIGNPGGVILNGTLNFTSVYTGLDKHRFRVELGNNYLSADTHETKNFGPGILDVLPLPSTVNGQTTEMRDTPNIFLQDLSRRAQYFLVQDEWSIAENINSTLGVRYDHYNDIGGTTNPRLGLVWEANEKLIAKLMLGSAYREPSVAELYFKNNPVALGNKNVKPETIRTQEISFDYRPIESLQSILTLFNYQARGMIDFLPDANGTTESAQNRNAHNGKGFEWEINWRPINSLQVASSYSLQKSYDILTDKTSPYAPAKQWKTNLNWQFANRWSLSSQVYWIADRARAEGDLRSKISDYTLWNFSLTRKKLLQNMDAQLTVRNAGNARAKEPSDGVIKDDFPLESRSLWLGLTWNL